jgi:hypothetical protein
MFVTFYFVIGFQIEGETVGYFILMLFLANWVVMSLGQFFALASPNEESATGLAGLSVILSVILMGFLITANAMPSGWTWSYWANMFHYIVQGLVTNELAGQENDVALPPIGELIPARLNATRDVVFPLGWDVSSPSDVARQTATFFALAIEAGPGTNYDWNASGLASLVRCMVENECLTEPLEENFIRCNMVNWPQRPPCRSEFQNAVEVVNTTALASCVRPLLSPTSNATLSDAKSSHQLFDSLDAARLGDVARREQLQVVLCVLRVLLPAGALDDFIRSLLSLLQEAIRIIAFVVDIIDNGIMIPADLILWVFGWAEFQDGELIPPFKWYCCLFAVAVFLIGLQLLQLIALRFVVWTRR